jgi:hypothetical protein
MRSANRVPRSTARKRSRANPVLGAAPLLLAMLFAATAQPCRAQSQRSFDLGLAYTQERSKFIGPAAGNYFYLRGATVDVAEDLYKGIGLSVEGTGISSTNLEGNIDIEHVQFLAGPRYTRNFGRNSDFAWNRHAGVFVEAKAGYTFATSGLYPVNGVVQSHAAGLTYLGGGGVNFKIYHRFDLRLIEVGYERTQLPNGTTNVQNTLRVSSGINFHFGS